MSATITTTLERPLKTAPLHTTLVATCQKCGADVSHIQQGIAEEAQRRIEELEQQARILTEKATAAVDKLADYEDQLHQLKSQSHPQLKAPPNTPYPSAPPSAAPSAPPSEPATPYPHISETVPPRPHSAVSRLSALLPSTRRSASQPPTSSMPTTPLQHASFPPGSTPTSSYAPYLSASQTPASQTPITLHPPPLNRSSSGTPSANDLLMALTHESALRRAAETQLEKTSEEVEELTSSLFSEANEMVAQERKTNKQLADRLRELEARASVTVNGNWREEWAREKEALERKMREKEERVEVLERRAREKDERLEGLERRVVRGERVRGLLSSGGAGTPPLLSPHLPSPLGQHSSLAGAGAGGK